MKFSTSLKVLCTCFLVLVLAFHSRGQQPWLEAVKDKKNASFFEIRQSFHNYWKEKVPKSKGGIPKSKGYKQFKRWEWFWEPRVGRSGTFPQFSVLIDEWEKYRLTHPGQGKHGSTGNSLSQSDLSGNGQTTTEQTATPPAPSVSGGWVPLGPSSSLSGYSGVGRLDHIAFHPTDPNTFWVGSPSGGLWKTTTGGASWTVLTDNLPVLGVSAIAVDPANPNILYIATGDRDHYATYSVGVLKSVNGGASWNSTGLSYSVSQQLKVKGLVIHPTNPQILIAATSNGLYRTVDGGTNWTLEQSGDFQEVLFKPGDPTVVYACTISSPQIFRSVNTGDSWSQVTSFSGINRIALAVTPANPAVVGALCSNSSNSGFGGYYTSTNSGASFNLTYAATGLNLLGYERNGSGSGGQGWYDLCVAISPTNANVVYVGGVNTWKSTNGGASWAISTMWYNDGSGVPVVHADKHWMAFHPLSTGTLYQCNDGGLYRTSDGGATWADLSNGLQITQLYRFGNAATNANLTLGGTQDNGTKLRNASTYTDVLGGDGMEAIIDYSNANVMYGSLYYGWIHKSTNGGASWTDISGTLPSGGWVTPYVIDPANPQILYVGVSGNVYKTTNGGGSWVPISSGLSFYELQSLAVAPSNPQTIYAGSYYSLYKTTNGGGSWSAVPLPAFEALTSIEVHPTNPNIVWITFSGYSAASKVFRTDNGGASWTNISGTLPNLPANTIEYDKVTGVLYLGNDVGVFVRSPSMSDWQLFDQGLPNVVVNELELQYNATHSLSRLRAATYGRGIWESDLFSAAPTITTFLPTSGPAGIGVMIKGTNFTNVSAVRFNGVSATQTYVATSGLLYAAVPSGATTGKIQVVANGSTATSAATFTVAAITSKWTSKTALTTPRIQHGTIATGGRIYVFGGYNSAGHVNGLEIYNPSTNSWSAGAPMPMAIRGMAFALGSNGAIYMFGGANSSTTIAKTYRYTPSTNTWVELASMPAAVFEAAAAATSNGKIYVFGGEPVTAKSTSTNATRIYDIATNTWSSGANMPVGVQQHCAVTGADGKIYVIGGRAFSSKEPLGLVQIYNPSTNTWSSGAAMPIPKVQFGAVRSGGDGKIYVLGGKAKEPNYSGPYFHTVEVYNPATNTWATGPVLPKQIGQLTAAKLSDNLYALGGTSATSAGTFTYQLILPPVTPASLTAKAVSSSRIDLKWTDKSLNETGFTIERATSSTGVYAVIATVGAGVTSYANTGLAAATTYYYRVKATNSAGSSAYSNTASAKTLSTASVVSVDKGRDLLPAAGNRLLVQPNPVRSSTKVSFVVDADQQVVLGIYDARGNLIKQLYQGMAEGNRPYQFEWSAGAHASGTYFSRLTTQKGAVLSQKLVVLKP